MKASSASSVERRQRPSSASVERRPKGFPSSDFGRDRSRLTRLALRYTPTLKTIKPFVLEGDGVTLTEYDAEDDVLKGLYEYYLATEVSYGMMEGATPEQSSRMQAMENATKNSGELIDKLQLIYNRARQARITTELIEIISGASALEG